MKERGPGLVASALADVLEQYIEKLPGSMVLEKWFANMIRLQSPLMNLTSGKFR